MKRTIFLTFLMLFTIFTGFAQYLKIDSTNSNIIIHSVYDTLNMHVSNCTNKPCSSDLDIDNDGIIDAKVKMSSGIGGQGSSCDLFIETYSTTYYIQDTTYTDSCFTVISASLCKYKVAKPFVLGDTIFASDYLCNQKAQFRIGALALILL